MANGRKRSRVRRKEPWSHRCSPTCISTTCSIYGRMPGAGKWQTFLIATEGSSDVHILKHALSLLRPGIADFFRFIDVSESHPFSGTGNLLKFAEGLAKIDVQNQVVFLFDNDAEGLDAHQRLSRLTLPINMRGIMLPELEVFRSFPAR